LILHFPKDLLTINKCRLAFNVHADSGSKSPNYEIDELYYNVSGDELRIGWYENNNPLNFIQSNPVIFISGKTTGNFKQGEVIRFTVADNPLSEIADPEGNIIDNVHFKISEIENKYNVIAQDREMVLGNDMFIYPNPANDALTISYNLINDGLIQISFYDILGNKILEVINCQELKGSYNKEVNLSNLSSGVYSCKMISGSNTLIVKRVIVAKH
jgi:hypothetical protein